MSETQNSAPERTAAVYVDENLDVSYFHHKCAEMLGFHGIETPVLVETIPPAKMTCPRFGCGKLLTEES